MVPSEKNQGTTGIVKQYLKNWFEKYSRSYSTLAIKGITEALSVCSILSLHHSTTTTIFSIRHNLEIKNTTV